MTNIVNIQEDKLMNNKFPKHFTYSVYNKSDYPMSYRNLAKELQKLFYICHIKYGMGDITYEEFLDSTHSPHIKIFKPESEHVFRCEADGDYATLFDFVITHTVSLITGVLSFETPKIRIECLKIS